MPVAVLEEEELPTPELIRLFEEAPSAEKVAIPKAPPAARPKPPKEMSDMVQALASVLTVRLCLAMAIVGAFVLAMCVVQRPTIEAILALGIFTVVIVPLCWLAQKRVA